MTALLSRAVNQPFQVSMPVERISEKLKLAKGSKTVMARVGKLEAIDNQIKKKQEELFELKEKVIRWQKK